MSDIRLKVVQQAIANSALSNCYLSDFGLDILNRWASGELSVDQGIVLIKKYYSDLEVISSSDGLAGDNLLGITDSKRLKVFSTDASTLRMVQLMG